MKENQEAGYLLRKTNGRRIFSMNVRKGCHVTRIVHKAICPVPKETIYQRGMNLEDSVRALIFMRFPAKANSILFPTS